MADWAGVRTVHVITGMPMPERQSIGTVDAIGQKVRHRFSVMQELAEREFRLVVEMAPVLAGFVVIRLRHHAERRVADTEVSAVVAQMRHHGGIKTLDRQRPGVG